MEYNKEFYHFLEYSGKDPSRLIFEDELTAIYNRRFLLQFLEYKVQWDHLNNDPLSLIMLDVDNFKQINDTYGHDIGDQALIWIANLLKEVTNKGSMAIRYAGDEFMILMQHSDKRAAMNLGECLLKRAREGSLPTGTQDIDIKISVSIGVASAPENAQTSKELIQQADVALYYAKKNGRDALANADDVNQEAVFSKTAIYKLSDVKLVGRSAQLSQVTDALNKLNTHQNQFMLLEGPNGIGKTEFLETIRRNLTDDNVWSLKINGDSQEMFRPYYLAIQLLLEMLNVHKKQGKVVLEELSAEERVYLAQILPSLDSKRPTSLTINSSIYRAGIFETLVKVITKMTGMRPLILLIDDMHLADEATLMLLRKLMHQKSISLFICASQLREKKTITSADHQNNPLKLFYESYQQELSIKKVALTPLTIMDIEEHIRGIFPHARIPKNFSTDLAKASQGNPLFLSEILRKMVLDNKITLIGHQWNIETLEEGYLPKSFEEIVSQKIAALDEESRQMLDQVSAFGGDVPLSIITGSSHKMEAKVLEFIDKAKAQGLLSSHFHSNDEVVRFLGERIFDIVYGAIEQNRRQKLHEEIGIYQEALFKEKLLPSAAPLAYHFERSANKQKAENYERILNEVNQNTFNSKEAVEYSKISGTGTKAREKEIPLNPKDLEYMPDLIRNFIVAVRNINLYPAGSDSIVKVIRQFKSTVDRILANNDYLSILQIKQSVLINGQKIDISGCKQVVETFLDLLNRFELKGIAFHQGLNERELEIVLHALGQTKPNIFDEKYWERFASEKQLDHIDLKQMRYAIAVQSTTSDDLQTNSSVEPSTHQDLYESGSTLGDVEKKLLPDIVRNLLGTIRAIKLYPVKSETVVASIARVLQILERFFALQKSLTFGRAGDALLVNGEKVDIPERADSKGLMVTWAKFLDEAGLDSLTFLEHTSVHQMEAFLGIISEISQKVVDKEFWEEMAQKRGLTAILFNRQLYEVQMAPRLTGRTKVIESSVQTMAMAKISPDGAIPPERFEDYLKDIEEKMGAMYFEGHLERIEQALESMFLEFAQRDLPLREKVIEVCQNLLESLTVAFQHNFAKLVFSPLLEKFDEEKEPTLIAVMGTLLNRIVSILVQFMEYPQAARILFHLHKRYREFKHESGSHSHIFPKGMEWKLESTVHQLLIEDLKSSDPIRQSNAAQLLASLKFESLPVLMDIIKGEDNQRARKTAANLIRELGPLAIERLKKLLVLEINPDERTRILEIIDTITTNLQTELVQALGDENPSVRQAAYRLAERLKGDKITKLLTELAGSQQVILATGAIKCLGTLKTPGVDEELIHILNSTKENDVRIACCRALGQIGRPTCIEPLAKLLKTRRFLFFRKRKKDHIRAVAAFALKQIPQLQVTQVLGRFINDPDPAVREIARSVGQTAQNPVKAAAN
ncbi:MAG: diguanylate cyclase [bacterium]